MSSAGVANSARLRYWSLTQWSMSQAPQFIIISFP